MAPAVRFAPSLLSADFSRLGEEVEVMDAARADLIHWDIMDGRFVPNLTIGPDVVASVRNRTTLPFEAHLMVEDPDPLLSRWVDAGCEGITVHAEACRHLHRTLGAIRDLGARPGVALNPATPVASVRHVLDLVDVVLVMTVNPGFGGQVHLTSMLPKIEELNELAGRTGSRIEIEVDGGITADSVTGALGAGATTFVVGSWLQRHPRGAKAGISELRACTDRAKSPSGGSSPCHGRDKALSHV